MLVTVAAAKGSTPREVGAKMIVAPDGIEGSVGGGHLELVAIEEARKALADARPGAARLRDFALGPALGQCCGGFTTLLFEPLGPESPAWLDRLAGLERAGEAAVLVTGLEGAPRAKVVVTREAARPGELPGAVAARVRATLEGGAEGGVVKAGEAGVYVVDPLVDEDFEVYLFGAGHVGGALVRLLGGLSCRVVWIDGREPAFPEAVPANVEVRVCELPAPEADDAPPGTLFLVMTHSHALDLRICQRILRRGDFEYLGLIGSRTKRARFERDLGARGIDRATLARLVCPIGVSGITGKEPSRIALATAAQLLQVADAARARRREAESGESAAARG